MNSPRFTSRWRLGALVALVLLAAYLVHEWASPGHSSGPKARFELVPLSPAEVAADWMKLPVVATVDSHGHEWAGVPLGAFLLLRVEISRYPDEAPSLYYVRLGDSPDPDDSAVLLWPDAFDRRELAIPTGTWRLRRDDVRDEWLITHAPAPKVQEPGDEVLAPEGPEKLAVAVRRSPVPMGIRRSPEPLCCVIAACLFALAGSLWKTRVALRRRLWGSINGALTAATSASVAAALLALALQPSPRVEPAWDLQPLPATADLTDWARWQLVDIDRGPFRWAHTWSGHSERVAHLGSFLVRSSVDADHTGLLGETNARVCATDSCVWLPDPVCSPRTAQGPDPAGCPVVYGLRRQPARDLWAVTFANRHRETAVAAAWTRVAHTELGERAPWLPWVCLGLAAAVLLVDILFLRSSPREG